MTEFERLINHLLNQFLVYSQNSPLLFNSGIFLVLFLIFYGGYIFLYKNDLLRMAYVIVFSFFFYYKSFRKTSFILPCLYLGQSEDGIFRKERYLGR